MVAVVVVVLFSGYNRQAGFDEKQKQKIMVSPRG